MSKFLIHLLILYLMGCVTQQSLTSCNNFPYTLQNMVFHVCASWVRIACSYVSPERVCSNRFPARPYQVYAAFVSWLLDGKQWQKEVVADDVT